MTTCLICHTDITENVKQFGNCKDPMCQSCWLDDNDWIYDEPDIVDALKRGLSMDEAQKLVVREHLTELEAFALAEFEANHA